MREPSSEYIVLIPVNGDSFIQLLGAKDVPNSIQRIYSRVIKRENCQKKMTINDTGGKEIQDIMTYYLWINDRTLKFNQGLWIIY